MEKLVGFFIADKSIIQTIFDILFYIPQVFNNSQM